MNTVSSSNNSMHSFLNTTASLSLTYPQTLGIIPKSQYFARPGFSLHHK